MRRGPYAKVSERNQGLLAHIRRVKADHPFWGYRRVWAYVRYVEQQVVTQKRIYRLMKLHGLLVQPNLRLKASRGSHRRKPKPTAPNRWWGIDMTKVLIDDFGWIYVVLVLDWYTKKIVGHYAGLQAKTWHWLVAVNTAVQEQFPDGAKDQGLSLMADNGCQPTAVAFMQACRAMSITQAFTSYNNPKGNADTERMMRTLKEELVWIHEWKSPVEFFEALEGWVKKSNNEYLHSALGYQTPMAFEHQYATRWTQLQTA